MRRPNPRHAYDQLFEQTTASPTYNQGNGNGDQSPISGSDCLQFVQLCLAKLAGPDREEFLMGLTDLLGTEEPAQDGIVAHNSGALDRRTVRRTSRDNSIRRPGMDSAIAVLQSNSFAKRFPFVNVKFSGTGR